MEGWEGQLEARFFWSDVLMFCLPALPGGGGEGMYVHFDILDMQHLPETRVFQFYTTCDTFSPKSVRCQHSVLGVLTRSQVAELPVSITATRKLIVYVGKGDRSLLSSVHLRCLLSSLSTPDKLSF